ncbi:hypothetical protein L596_003030 [Steinernema carpocapsae]|uniref:Uncharacterized protein n=2 Tax=Steinernema carpocapsae TaxID=34508 RepID=A0A4U8UQW3_STECR|nr:hypothetical protein L596_003030 [Steinernema carpocapsae]
MTTRHSDVINALNNPAAHGEERKTSQIFMIIDPGHHRLYPGLYKTISELRRVYGDVVEKTQKELEEIEEMVDRLYQIYDEDNFHSQLVGHNLNRMDKILALVDQYTEGKLQRKAWAEKMQSRNMRHFFEEDFYDGWYNPILKDLDQNIVKAINDIEYDLPSFINLTVNGTGLKTGSIMLFGNTAPEHIRKFSDFLDDIINCTRSEVRNESISILKEFKNAMHEFQGAYSNLFKKELPDYLENFDFGPKFIKENFAQVNVFLHKMNVEHWKQHSTYSIWSLACDVGGALGLFLGVSLLTVIELLYLCYSCCRSRWLGPHAKKWLSNKRMKIKVMTEKRWNAYRDARKGDVMTRSLMEDKEGQAGTPSQDQRASNTQLTDVDGIFDDLYNEIDDVITEEDGETSADDERAGNLREQYQIAETDQADDASGLRTVRSSGSGAFKKSHSDEPLLLGSNNADDKIQNSYLRAIHGGNLLDMPDDEFSSTEQPLSSSLHQSVSNTHSHFVKHREQKPKAEVKQASLRSLSTQESTFQRNSQNLDNSESTNTITNSSSSAGQARLFASSSPRQTIV